MRGIMKYFTDSTRAYIYQILVLVFGVLTFKGVVDDAHSTLILTAAGAVLTNVFALVNAKGKTWRANVYGVVAAVGALAVGYGWIAGAEVSVYLALIAGILGTSLAGANTSTQDLDLAA